MLGRFGLPLLRDGTLGPDLELVRRTPTLLLHLPLSFAVVFQLEAPLGDKVIEIAGPQLFDAELDQRIDLGFLVANLCQELVDLFLGE